jgi:hypothetical protein
LAIGFGRVLDWVEGQACDVAHVDVVHQEGCGCGKLVAGEDGEDFAVCRADFVDGFGGDQGWTYDEAVVCNRSVLDAERFKGVRGRLTRGSQQPW